MARDVVSSRAGQVPYRTYAGTPREAVGGDQASQDRVVLRACRRPPGRRLHEYKGPEEDPAARWPAERVP